MNSKLASLLVDFSCYLLKKNRKNSATPLRRRSLKFETPSSVGGDVDDEDLERGYGPSLFRAGESSLPVLLAQLPPVTFYSDLNKLFEFFFLFMG